MKSSTAILYTFDSLQSGDTVHHASVSQDGVDLRVDWDGGSSPGSPGTADVLVVANIWEACINIGTKGPCDLLMAEGGFDHVRLSRGPDWGAYPFEAKLVPIEWIEGHKPTGEIPLDTVVELDVDYTYPSGVTPDSVSWQESVANPQGMHILTLQHDQAASFELWVRLLDPGNPSGWLCLRPIVRPGDGDPTPT